MPSRIALLHLLALLISVTSIDGAEPESKSGIDFNRDIRPILSNHCYACHGPSATDQKAGLRLDDRDVAISKLESGAAAIVPGDLKASELVARIHADDEYTVMPPPEIHKPLSPQQKKLLERWIASGAEYAPHWSFVPPTRPVVPKVDSSRQAKNAIDAFVTRRLKKESLSLSPETDRTTLIRRVTLDLTGLPPTPDEVEAFLTDDSPTAYEDLVDRLLASEAFGEHKGRYWLDLVRYGDTHGLHLDNYREMWPYRDYVIKSFNNDMPFDQFIIEQMAGDLLPEATLEQQVASGFNRLNVTTSEGGSIYEEVYVRNVVDRVEAFGTVFLGLTTGCATCHDHKFDPISQEEFYSLFAYFNSLDGRALDGNKKDHPPVVRVETDEYHRKQRELDQRLVTVREKFLGEFPKVDLAQSAWEREISTPDEPQAEPAPLVWDVVTPAEFIARDGTVLAVGTDGKISSSGPNPAKEVVTLTTAVPAGGTVRGLRLEAFAQEKGKKGAGRSSNTNAVLSEFVVEFATSEKPNDWQKVGISKANANHSQTNGPFDISYAIDGKFDPKNGWAITGYERFEDLEAAFQLAQPITLPSGGSLRVKLHYESQFAQHSFATVRLSMSEADPLANSEVTLEVGNWSAIGPFEIDYESAAVTQKVGGEGGKFDPKQTFKHREKTLSWTAQSGWSDGQSHQLPTIDNQVTTTLLHRTITASEATKATLLFGADDGYRVYLNGKQLLENREEASLIEYGERIALDLKEGVNHLYVKVADFDGRSPFVTALRHAAAPVPAGILVIAKTPAEQRSDAQGETLRNYYRKVVSEDPEIVKLNQEFDTVRTERQNLEKTLPTTLVFKELTSPRPSHILTRGEYDQKGKVVGRKTPAALPPMDESLPQNRLGLAQWLVSPGHPLTSRVAMNRFWQQLFGTGLVKTSEDFGAQGQLPSHPELLDWLAVEFQESGWDVKHMYRLMVTSATYRQSSVVTPKLLEIDPENRLLGRAPRFRLDAEMLRDQALAVSGLLVNKIGGPSVKPPQPAGLWKAVGYSGSNTVNFKADTGDAIYRRSVYTFWKRTAPAPTMTAFDAPSRERCTARRERTNTPLQALVLMNETQYLDASRHIARRVLQSGAADRRGRIDHAYLQVVARHATPSELDELEGLLNWAEDSFAQDGESAKKLAGSLAADGELKASPASLAAWTLTANLMLNLDEVVTRN